MARIEELAAKVKEARGLRSKTLEEVSVLTRSTAKAIFEQYSDSFISIEDLVRRANLKNGKSVKTVEHPSPIQCLRLSAMRTGRIDCQDAKPVPMAIEEAKE